VETKKANLIEVESRKKTQGNTLKTVEQCRVGGTE
jgi:hypothetical protein